MTVPDSEFYDHLFDEVRAALVEDVGYSIKLAEEARRMRNRKESQEARHAAKKAARPESNTDLQ